MDFRIEIHLRRIGRIPFTQRSAAGLLRNLQFFLLESPNNVRLFHSAYHHLLTLTRMSRLGSRTRLEPHGGDEHTRLGPLRTSTLSAAFNAPHPLGVSDSVSKG